MSIGTEAAVSVSIVIPVTVAEAGLQGAGRKQE